MMSINIDQYNLNSVRILRCLWLFMISLLIAKFTHFHVLIGLFWKLTRSREEIKISYDFDFKGHQGHQVIKGYPSLLVTASTLSNFIIMKNQNEFFLSCSIQTSLSSQVEAIWCSTFIESWTIYLNVLWWS